MRALKPGEQNPEIPPGFMSIGLGDGRILLEEEKANVLLAWMQNPAMGVLLEIMQGMKDSATYSLRDKKFGLDDLRVFQGQIESLTLLANILTADLPEWRATAEAAAKAKSEGTGEDESEQ